MDLKTLEKTVSLARLELNEREKDQFLSQMANVISYFEELSQIATEKVEPLVTPTDLKNCLRSDQVSAWPNTKDILEAVPNKQGHLIKVPQVV